MSFRINRSIRILMAGTALGMGAAVQADAAGFYLQDQSVKADGRAFSGEVSDTGASSLWWNPAAIGGISGLEFTNSATTVLTDAKVSDRGSNITYLGGSAQPVGGQARAYNPIELGVIPSAAVAMPIGHGLSVGLSVTSPFSFATKYDNDSFARYSAATTRLTTIDIQPTLAWKPVSWLSIGAGPNIEYSNAVLSSALPQLLGGPDGYDYLHGNGWDVGYNVGAQVKPVESVTVGVAYRSKIKHTLDGSVQIAGLTGLLAGINQNTAASAKFTTPWAATFGVRWKVTDKLTLEGQGVRTGWSDFNQITLISTAPLPAQAEDYKDTTSGALGLDYDVTPRWTMRAGVQYDPTPTVNFNRDARVPDGDRFLYAVGTSFRATRRLVLDGSISYIDFRKTHVNQTIDQLDGLVPISTHGEVQASALTLGVGSHFYF